MKKKLSTVIILFIALIGNQVFGQKLTTEEVKQKISKSWTATEVGNPGETLFPKESLEMMDFNSDGFLHMERESKMMGKMTADARWEFDKKKQKLILTLQMGDRKETQEIDIKELTDSRMVLSSPVKETVYIPTSMIAAEQPVVVTPPNVVDAAGLDVANWKGKMEYHAVLILDHNDVETEQQETGIIELLYLGDRKIIVKTVAGVSVNWTIIGDNEIAGLTRYDAVCSDPELTGEITFQNGNMMIERYNPNYLSYYYIK